MSFHEKTVCLRKTGWVTSELYFWHDTRGWAGYLEPSLTIQPGEHFENPETKRRFYALTAATGLADHLVPVKPRIATDEEILTIHTPGHLARLTALCERGGGDAGGSTPVGSASLDIARLAAGGVFAAVDAVCRGEVENAYVLCRPPGHHAEPDAAMGFCLLANAALGVKYAQSQYNLKKIATVDWDVHHGNGTETIFYDDPTVLTVSLHQDRLFPTDRGMTEALGNGAARGTNLNIPLPPGSGSGAYRAAFEELVLPALEAFAPEAIFLPCGYDASALDPLGVMMLSSDDFRWMTRKIVEFADRFCNGRVIVTHEGGYSATYVPYCGLAVLEELSGTSGEFRDPFAPDIRAYGGQTLSNDQRASISRSKKIFFG